MSTELERLASGPASGEQPPNLGYVRFEGYCLGNAASVLSLARETLKESLILTSENVFDPDVWRERLPREFVKHCENDPVNAAAFESMQSLDVDERAKQQAEMRWSVRMFMNSFLPELDMRLWEWWDAEVIPPDHFVVLVSVRDWPFPWESLRWLFRGCGATDLSPEETGL